MGCLYPSAWLKLFFLGNVLSFYCVCQELLLGGPEVCGGRVCRMWEASLAEWDQSLETTGMNSGDVRLFIPSSWRSSCDSSCTYRNVLVNSSLYNLARFLLLVFVWTTLQSKLSNIQVRRVDSGDNVRQGRVGRRQISLAGDYWGQSELEPVEKLGC